MKAVVEYWSTGVRQYSKEYWMIVRNAFGYNGLGVSLSRVLVVGATIPEGRDGEARYQYTFLWILDPKASEMLGVNGHYLVKFRQAMCDLFRLVKVEVVFDQTNVDDLEHSMLKAHEDSPEVLFVEEFFYSPESLYKLDRQFRYNRELRTPPEDRLAPSVVVQKPPSNTPELPRRSVVDMSAQRARFR